MTPGKLWWWYNTAHNSLVTYRTKYDKSGSHEFNSEEGLKEFVTKFAQGNCDCCFLAAPVSWRGDDAMEWFSGSLPKDVEVVDGWEASPACDTMSEEFFREDSTQGGGDGVSDIECLITAVTTSNESPEKKAYFEEKKRLASFGSVEGWQEKKKYDEACMWATPWIQEYNSVIV